MLLVYSTYLVNLNNSTNVLWLFGTKGTLRDKNWYTKAKKFKIDDIHSERRFLYILGDPGSLCGGRSENIIKVVLASSDIRGVEWPSSVFLCLGQKSKIRLNFISNEYKKICFWNLLVFNGLDNRYQLFFDQ